MWPLLLEYIAQEPYTEAVGVLSSSLAHLSSKKRQEEAEDYTIDYETNVNIPKPHAIIARLMVKKCVYTPTFLVALM